MPAANKIIIRKTLASDTIKLGEQARSLLGKNVEIVIREITDPKPADKTWQYLGSVSLGRNTDTINIRDFAHDD